MTFPHKIGVHIRLSLLTVMISVSLAVQGQVRATGKVLSLPGRQPIAFANIGIVNSSVGTISNEDGTFSFTIPQKHARDSVIFSALGFGKKLVPVSVLSPASGLTIYLKETPTNLHEVVVTGETWKRKVNRLGNRQFQGGSLYADTLTAGSAMALLISNKIEDGTSYEYPVYAEDAQLMIVNNTFREFKVRVRLLDTDPSGLPGKDLLDQSVVIHSTLENGWLKVDLSSYKIEVNRDFYLVFEWILDAKDRKYLFAQYDEFRKKNPDKVSIDYSVVDGYSIPYMNYQGNFYAGTSFGVSVLPSSLKSEVCYYRLNSFGKWNRCTSVLAARVTVSDQPREIAKGKQKLEIEKDTSENEVLSYYRKDTSHPAAVNPDTVWANPHFFSTRFHEPILVEVHRHENQISFFANNLTFYPYQLTMEFSSMRNLSPLVDTKKFTLRRGLNRLLVFNVVDRELDNYHYELSIQESIGDPQAQPTEDFSHLIPIGQHRKADIMLPGAGGSTDRRQDQFKADGKADTVYAMRKGFVTALPIPVKAEDRILLEGSLEMLHPDGTVMVYLNLDPKQIFVRAGSTVFPGERLGILKPGQDVAVQLYQFSGEGNLKRLGILYFLDQNRSCEYQEIPKYFPVSYPESIVTKELTEREKEAYVKKRSVRN